MDVPERRIPGLRCCTGYKLCETLQCSVEASLGAGAQECNVNVIGYELDSLSRELNI